MGSGRTSYTIDGSEFRQVDDGRNVPCADEYCWLRWCAGSWDCVWVMLVPRGAVGFRRR